MILRAVEKPQLLILILSSVPGEVEICKPPAATVKPSCWRPMLSLPGLLTSQMLSLQDYHRGVRGGARRRGVLL